MSMRQLKISKQITNRETQSLDKYLQEIGKVGLISSDEEVKLAQRIRQGDAIALEKAHESKFEVCRIGSEAIPKLRFESR